MTFAPTRMPRNPSFLRNLVILSFAGAALGAGAQSPAPAAKKLPPGLAEIEWRADGSAAPLATEVAPGKFAEWCGSLRAGEKVQWEFQSAEPMDMNVHYHEGKNVHYPVKLDAVKAGKDTLEVKLAQEYCWMWSNKSGKASSLKATLRKLP